MLAGPRGLFFVLFILLANTAFCQQEDIVVYWEKELKKIEESNDSLFLKIDQLEYLYLAYNQTNHARDHVAAKTLHRMGQYHCKIGNFDKGIELLKQSVIINQRPNIEDFEESFLANSYFTLGFFYRKLNFFDEFQLYMDSCIAIAKNHPDVKEIGIHAHEQLAHHYLSIGEIHKALDMADEGLFFGKNLPDSPYNALLYLQKAQAQLDLDFDEADSLIINQAGRNINNAMDIFSKKKTDPNYLSVAYATKSKLYIKIGDYSKAIFYNLKAIEMDVEDNNYLNAVDNTLNLGVLYEVYIGDIEKALEIYNDCFSLLEKVKIPDQVALQGASIYNNLGVSYFFEKNYIKAIENFKKGIEVLYHHHLELPDAISSTKSKESIPILKSLYANIGETVLIQFNNQEIEKADLAKARNSFKMADKAVDLMRWNQSNQQSKLIWRNQTKSIYEYAIEVCFQLNDTENAFYFFEKSRAVLLNDKLNELGAQQYLSEEDQEKENSLRIQLMSAQQKLSQLEESDPNYQQYSSEYFYVQKSYEKFIKGLELKYPSYYQYKYDTLIPSISDLQSHMLGRDQTFIGYFTGQKHIYMLTVDSDSASLQRFASDHSSKDISELLGICADRSRVNQNYSRYSELSHKLYENLFKPLPVNTQRVIISPDDQFIPFELLLKERSNPTSFLLQDHAFSYTYSAGYLLKNRQENIQAQSILLGMAPVNYQPHLQQASLQGADLSLSTIQSNFSSSQHFIREKATKNGFLENLPQYAIVHLYSHAEADVEGTEPTIYFYDSALLVSDLQLLGDLPTRLIVLSACNTGVGKNMKGEGVFSLARGFAAAGIPSSITSLWQIDNHSTYKINELFYRYLSQGLALDVALREAKLEFLRVQDKSYDLPYFWAASILIGNSEEFLPKNNNRILSSFNFMTGMVLLLIILSALIYYKKQGRNITNLLTGLLRKQN